MHKIRAFLKQMLVNFGVFGLLSRFLKNIYIIIKEYLFGRWFSMGIDVTNNCNLRCPFCYNEFKDSNLEAMTTETFSKVIKLFPLVLTRIRLSCNYEPFLNSNFINMLKMIPPGFIKRVGFSTNLTTLLSRAQIEEISRIQLKYINISVDSLTKTTYESFRKGAIGGVFDQFMANLDAFANILPKFNKYTKLRYTVMVFKDSYQESGHILKTLSEKYLASEVEFRRASVLPHKNEWIKKHSISDSDWLRLIEDLKNLPFKHKMVQSDSVYFGNSWYIPQGLYINCAGIVNTRDGRRFDIESISDPFNYFRKLRK